MHDCKYCGEECDCPEDTLNCLGCFWCDEEDDYDDSEY